MATAALALFVACAPHASEAPRLPEAKPGPAWRTSGDATLKGPRLLPENLDSSPILGTEPSGASRILAGGLRILRLPGGGVVSSVEPLPLASPSSHGAEEIQSYSLPLRLGGGVLFAVQNTLYRAPSWLAPVQRFYTAPSQISEVVLGMDRVYVRSSVRRTEPGSQVALDPTTGAPLDLGPWPNAPSILGYRALDGWRAVAIADLRGAVATFDAGATWKPLSLPIGAFHAKSVEVARIDPVTGQSVLVPPGAATVGDSLVVRGADSPRQTESCFAVRADGTTSRLPVCPSPEPTMDPPPFAQDPSSPRLFGSNPLLTAIEDGFPIDGESALVARDGALGQVRLSDGVWTRVNLEAFASKPARCHPLPLLGDERAPGLGFGCIEPRGRVSLYSYDAAHFALSPVKSFEHPRPLLSFGNGAVAFRGGCQEGEASPQRYCLLSRPRAVASPALRAPRWIEVHLSPAPEESLRDSISSDGRRLLVFDDGRIAVLSPPSKVGEGHIDFLGEAAPEQVKLAFPELTPDVTRALESGVWLDGFEERRAGVAGGWVDASGAMLGIEIEENGHVRVGTWVRDAGSPVVSGRYGLGWGSAHRGYETSDGGMTWNAIEVPAPLSTTPRERACGPVGCTAAGWVRVGWGKAPVAPLEPPAFFRNAARAPRDLELSCEPVSGSAPPALPVAPSSPETAGFYGVKPPYGHTEDTKLAVDIHDSIDRASRTGPLARLYAWGPRSDDWTHLGRWSVRWLWPYGASSDVRSTATSLAPFSTPDAARRALGQVGSGGVVAWTMAVGDDASSALLVARRPCPDLTVLELDAERSSVEIRRADGEPFADVDFAMRAMGHWYLASSQAYAEPLAAVVLRVDGPKAVEFARVPRASLELRASPVRLARRGDGRAIGLVVDGQPPPDRSMALRWVLPIDVETGVAGEPELLGAADLSDRGDLRPCTQDHTGWVLDTSWSGKAHLHLGLGRAGVLTKLYVRVEMTSTGACIEELSGSFEADPQSTPTLGPALLPPSGPVLSASMFEGDKRIRLRCRSR